MPIPSSPIPPQNSPTLIYTLNKRPAGSSWAVSASVLSKLIGRKDWKAMSIMLAEITVAPEYMGHRGHTGGLLPIVEEVSGYGRQFRRIYWPGQKVSEFLVSFSPVSLPRWSIFIQGHIIVSLWVHVFVQGRGIGVVPVLFKLFPENTFTCEFFLWREGNKAEPIIWLFLPSQLAGGEILK